MRTEIASDKMRAAIAEMNAAIPEMSVAELLETRQFVLGLIEKLADRATSMSDSVLPSNLLDLIDLIRSFDSDPSEKPASYRPKPKGFAPK